MLAIAFWCLFQGSVLWFICDVMCRSRLIRFRRLHRERWEIAFSEEHLNAKLDGDMAEVIVPAKPLIVRAWRRIRPLKFIEAEVA